jgi:homoserine dehydrogenase
MREIGVGLLGLGNVGAGVVKLLAENAAAIEARLGARVVVRAIAVRDQVKRRLVDVNPELVTTDVHEVIDHPDVEIVCELIGGETRSRELVLRAIERGKHVVTANKALLAVHGEEIFAAAEQHGVDLYYEAAVCGGIPIIRALREGLASDRIDAIYGIINGTSNYVLTTMLEEGRAFDDVLADAQAAGYAEADPTLDVGGGDAAHKLAILAMLCFGTSVPFQDMHVEGIDRLSPVDFEYADRFGYVIKPLAIARHHKGSIEARVHPTMIPKNWLLSAVSGAKNALYVVSYALGGSMYYGAGAGMMPTAMSAVSDLIEVARNIQAKATGALPIRSYRQMQHLPLCPIDDIRTAYYMRFGVLDRPGVLAKLTTILGEHGVSIAQVIQESARSPDKPVRVVVLTHEAREGDVQAALREIDELEEVAEPTGTVRVES